VSRNAGSVTMSTGRRVHGLSQLYAKESRTEILWRGTARNAGEESAVGLGQRAGAEAVADETRRNQSKGCETAGPVGHLDAAVVVLKQSTPTDNDQVRGVSGSEQCRGAGTSPSYDTLSARNRAEVAQGRSDRNFHLAAMCGRKGFTKAGQNGGVAKVVVRISPQYQKLVHLRADSQLRADAGRGEHESSVWPGICLPS
jgi:hypothetical protein